MQKSQRIEYIDALRGFTMFLVVFQHVATFCWGILARDTINVHHYFLMVRMPLFFFISGFVLYKADVTWTFKHVTTFLKKKFMVQIIPTALFLTCFVYVKEKYFLDAVFSANKEGYWFTYTLFVFFFIYAITRFLVRRHEEWVLIPLGLMMYFLQYINGSLFPYPVSAIVDLAGVEKWYYPKFRNTLV